MQMSRKALIKMIILLERKMRTVSADTCPDSPDALKGPPHRFERRRRQQPARTQTLRQPCSVHCVHDGSKPRMMPFRARSARYARWAPLFRCGPGTKNGTRGAVDVLP